MSKPSTITLAPRGVLGRARAPVADLDPPPVAAGVGQRDAHRGRAELRFADLGPLDEGDPVGAEVVLEQTRVLAREAREAVEVEVRDRDLRAAVAMPDPERRAGDRIADPQPARGAAHERRLPGAELAAHEDEVAGAQAARQLRAQRLGLPGVRGLEHEHRRNLSGRFGADLLDERRQRADRGRVACQPQAADRGEHRRGCVAADLDACGIGQRDVQEVFVDERPAAVGERDPVAGEHREARPQAAASAVDGVA